MKKLIEQRHSGISMPLIHPVLVEGVRAGVADLAEGDEVVERVVPFLARKSHAPAVDMVDVQRVGGPAFPALAAVALECRRTVAAEIEVVFSSAPVALQVWARGVRGHNSRRLSFLLAGWAPMLRASTVGEWLAAVGAEFLSPSWRAPGFPAQLHLMRQICARTVRWAASIANLSVVDLGGEGHAANDACTFSGKAVAGRASRYHRARLASFHVGGKSLNENAAVGAGKITVFAHGLTVAGGCIHV